MTNDGVKGKNVPLKKPQKKIPATERERERAVSISISSNKSDREILY